MVDEKRRQAEQAIRELHADAIDSAYRISSFCEHVLKIDPVVMIAAARVLERLLHKHGDERVLGKAKTLEHLMPPDLIDLLLDGAVVDIMASDQVKESIIIKLDDDTKGNA